MKVTQDIGVSHTHENIWLSASLVTLIFLWESRKTLHSQNSTHIIMKHAFIETLPCSKHRVQHCRRREWYRRERIYSEEVCKSMHV